MANINSFFKSGLILIVALIMPVSLPAGAGEISKNKSIYSESSYNLLAGSRCYIHSSPFLNSPVLRTLPVGTPLRIVRLWEGDEGQDWAHIHVKSLDVSSTIGIPSKGWIKI